MGRRFTGVGGNSVLCDIFRFQHSAVVVLPGDQNAGFGDDRTFFQQLIAHRTVGITGIAVLGNRGSFIAANFLRVALGGNRRAICQLLAAILAVGIAGVAGLGAGGFHGIADLFVGVEARGGKLRGVGDVAGHSGDGLVPAAEGVGILAVTCTGRRNAAVYGCCTVFHPSAVQLRAIPVDPANSVGAQLRCIDRRVLRVAHHGDQLRRPAGKPVGILRVGSPDRRSRIGRKRAVVYRHGSQHSAVPVLPGNRALVGLGVHHAALFVERIAALRHQAVRRLHPIGAVFDHGAAGLILEIVVVPIHIAQTGLGILDTVLYPIGISFPIIEAIDALLPDAVCVEDVDHIFAAFIHAIKARGGIFAGAEIVLITVNGMPLLSGPSTCPHILCAGAIFDQIAADQDIVFEGVVVDADGLLSVHGRIVPGTEEIVLHLAARMGNCFPAGDTRTVFSEVELPVQREQTTELALGRAVVSQIIEELAALASNIAGQLLNASERLVALIVEPLAVLLHPALLDRLVQRVVVFKGAEVVLVEVRTPFPFSIVFVFIADIGINAVFFLIILVAGNGVHRRGTQINVIAELAGNGNGQAVVLPVGLVRGDKLQAAEDAEGVRGRGVDGLRLVFEVADQRQRIRTLIHLIGGQVKIFVDQLHASGIHGNAFGRLHLNLYLCVLADALGQLQQEIPRRGAAVISAGQQSHQRLDLLGNGDLLHVHRKGIGRIHRYVGLVNIVNIVAPGIGIGHLAIPRQQAVAAGNIIEVEGRLAGLIQIDGEHHGTGQLRLAVLQQRRADGHCADAGALIAGEGQAVDFSGLALKNGLTVLHKAQHHVASVHRHLIAVIHSRQRQVYRHAIDGIDALLAEFQRGGHHNMERFAAQHLSIGHHLHLHAAHGGCGKYTVADGADAAVADPKGRTLRQLRGVSGCADASGRDGQAGAHSEVVVICRNNGMVKLVGGTGCGYHHQRRADRAGIAVGRPVHHRQLILALLLGNEGRRAAAVQVHSNDAPGLQHDLRNLNGAAAGRNRLLPAVHDHQHHAVVRSDAHAGAGGAAVVIITAAGDDNLAVLDQHNAAAHSLGNIVLICSVIRGTADDGRTVFQNGKEVFAASAVILHALHDQRAGGGTVGHIIEVGVHAHHRGIVGNVQLRLLRIGMPGLSGIHLVLHPGHAPGRADIILIVGVNSHIAAGHVRRGNVVYQCLSVLCCGAAQSLGNARSQRGGLAGIHAVIVVAGSVGDHARQLIQIVGKGIAAGCAQIVDIRQPAAGLQSRNSRVALISAEHRRPDLLLGAGAGETAAQQELRPEPIRQAAAEIVAHHRADRLAAGEAAHDVIGVQIAVQVQDAEAMHIVVLRGIVISQVLAVGAQLIGHILHGGGGDGAMLLGIVDQVADIAAPAAKVAVGQGGSGIGLHGVIGNVHAAEHMDKIHLIPVGQGELLQAAQRLSGGAVGGILTGHVIGKVCLFLASQHGPAAAGILFHAAADIVDDQTHRVLAGVLPGIRLRIALQHLQVLKKRLILRRVLCRLHPGGVRRGDAAQAVVPGGIGIRRVAGVVCRAAKGHGREHRTGQQHQRQQARQPLLTLFHHFLPPLLRYFRFSIKSFRPSRIAYSWSICCPSGRGSMLTNTSRRTP